MVLAAPTEFCSLLPSGEASGALFGSLRGAANGCKVQATRSTPARLRALRTCRLRRAGFKGLAELVDSDLFLPGCASLRVGWTELCCMMFGLWAMSCPTPCAGRVVGVGRAVVAGVRAASAGWRYSAGRRAGGVRGGSVRADQRLCVAAAAAVVRCHCPDRAPSLHRVDRGWPVAASTPRGAGRTGRPRLDRLVSGRDRRSERASEGIFDGAEPGRSRQARLEDPRPVRSGGNATVGGISAANTNDAEALPPLVKAIPAIRSWRGPRRRRPAKLHADKAYDTANLPHGCVTVVLASVSPARASSPPNRLGRHRWVIMLDLMADRLSPPQPPLRPQGHTLPRLPHPCRGADLLQETREINHMRHGLSSTI
ncbi:putative transposase [Nocardia farcinica IFM 10152]|uniref:Putative transposase n=1 Tax=Nocardia farcinica (strain IFM 10152) TaxID=247156 RepID=Q5YPV0_NOCFA|nr:putative transposase [Nocardia farcinica IFM 10152]